MKQRNDMSQARNQGGGHLGICTPRNFQNIA